MAENEHIYVVNVIGNALPLPVTEEELHHLVKESAVTVMARASRHEVLKELAAFHDEQAKKSQDPE